MMGALVEATGGDDSILTTSTSFQMVCDPFKLLKHDKNDQELVLKFTSLVGKTQGFLVSLVS